MIHISKRKHSNLNCERNVMEQNAKYIQALIDETLATADTDPSTTWDEFYQTLSANAKKGYAALIGEVCSYEETEACDNYIELDDVFEAIVTKHKTTVDSLVDFFIEKVLSDLEWEADVEQQAREDARYARGEQEYDEWRDRGFR